jgi:hypothetical protein
MSEDSGEKRPPKYRSLRQLLKDYPNSSQRVIGSGTVRVDPEEIRNSESYKEMVKKIRAYVKENNLE